MDHWTSEAECKWSVQPYLIMGKMDLTRNRYNAGWSSVHTNRKTHIYTYKHKYMVHTYMHAYIHLIHKYIHTL